MAGFRARLIYSGILIAMLVGSAAGGAGLVYRLGAAAGIPWVVVLATLNGVAIAHLAGSLRKRRRWRWPLAELERTLGQIRAGEAPIEELSRIEGPLRPLVGSIQEVLRELKQQKAKLAELNEEIRQRVAQRTDALERRIGSLRQQAARDPLTGLYNRRMLDQCLPRLIDEATASKSDLCMVMIDLDYFKVLNDTLGHAAGDRMLQTIGQLIRSSIREGDLAFRCGGDEFIVVLPSCGEEAGKHLAQRLASLVEGVSKTVKVPRRLGLCAGVVALSEVREDGDTRMASLVRMADERLYKEKRR